MRTVTLYLRAYCANPVTYPFTVFVALGAGICYIGSIGDVGPVKILNVSMGALVTVMATIAVLRATHGTVLGYRYMRAMLKIRGPKAYKESRNVGACVSAGMRMARTDLEREFNQNR